MRRVLDQTPGELVTMGELAERVFDTAAPTRAEVESVRRASKRLAEQGRLELDYVWAPHLHPSWSSEYDRDHGLWSSVCAKHGYEDDARPNSPGWALAVRRTSKEETS